MRRRPTDSMIKIRYLLLQPRILFLVVISMLQVPIPCRCLAIECNFTLAHNVLADNKSIVTATRTGSGELKGNKIRNGNKKDLTRPFCPLCSVPIFM